MKKTYKIYVDCANCAYLMEEATNKISGVKNATVNFMTQKLTIEFEDGADCLAVTDKVIKECKKVDSDFEIKHTGV